MSKTPCIVITRDRVSYTRPFVASLERFADQLDIFIVDHGSTYEPMLQWLDGCPHRVWRCGGLPPRALWYAGGDDVLPRIVGQDRRYIVTDPDLEFDESCPTDWLAMLDKELSDEAYSTGWAKVGMSLRLDDLYAGAGLGRDVHAWEAPFWRHRTMSGRAWRAPVDTTLALYRPLSEVPYFALVPAARLDAPYLMRHLPWYGDEREHGEEAAWYREHALEGSSHWIRGGWGK